MNHTAELGRNPPLLRVTNLHVSYGMNAALTGVTFTVPAGRIYRLTGMNGFGGFTLSKSIMNSVPRLAGMVKVAGMDVNVARKRGLISYVAQNGEIDWGSPVSVNRVVMMGRYGSMGPLRHPRVADREAVNKVLELVEPADLRHRQIGVLSGGQRKWVFTARAVAQGAPLILPDEPSAGADRCSEAAIVEPLHRLVAQGTELIVSTHDLVSMGKLCDEAVLLHHQVVCHGDVDGALRPKNLAKAFGLNDSEDTAEDASDPDETPATQGGQK